MPAVLSSLSNLRVLYLHSCFRQEPPEADFQRALGPLRQLGMLSLSACHLTRVPEAVAAKTSLRVRVYVCGGWVVGGVVGWWQRGLQRLICCTFPLPSILRQRAPWQCSCCAAQQRGRGASPLLQLPPCGCAPHSMQHVCVCPRRPRRPPFPAHIATPPAWVCLVIAGPAHISTPPF